MIIMKKMRIKQLNKKIKAMQVARAQVQPSEAELIKERELYKNLADIYQLLASDEQFPANAIMLREVRRTAATIEDAEAAYLLGYSCLEEAKYRAEIELNGVYANPTNQKRAIQLYEEAHAYLQSAQDLGHVQAKRLLGLSYINAWGVPENKEKGFELVVASIEQEGSWDKLTEIFSDLGLNNPEFFADLVRFRHKK